MAILIADSGATKTEWCLKADGDVKIIETEGLNPYFHTRQSIKDVLKFSLLPGLGDAAIDAVYFYGAGCHNQAKIGDIESALGDCFSTASIYVNHDLLGAARACFHGQAGIACILGTGSNSCLYDGQTIKEHIPSLAFILGDEGSAAYFGKKLINSYYRSELPAELKKELEHNYDVSLDHIMDGVYKGSQKSRFIASYASFLGENSQNPYIKDMLYEGFENFVSRILLNYTNAKSCEIRFVGSVAFAHQEMIKAILAKHGLTPGLFVQKPMQRLIEFHSE